ncbi:MAG: TlpA family protein disulfide reductase [Acidimicrobiia bacterium]|nr:TlpA family protein disulfide reductase [Acidimicrobiia bacterium]
MLSTGSAAPSLHLPGAGSGAAETDPWTAGPVVLAFFKTTCPVCHMSAPKVQEMADSGARVIAIGQDPVGDITAYSEMTGMRVPTISESEPYPISDAYGLSTVPTLFLVDAGGVIADAVAGWDRDGWNRLSEAAGAGVVSHDGDGLPSFRPG